MRAAPCDAREALRVRTWRAAGGLIATLVLGGVALGVTAVAAGAATVVAPDDGAVTLVFSSAQRLPVLPVPADGRLDGYGFVAHVTGDECAPSVGTQGAEITTTSGNEVCVFSLAVSFEQPDTTGPGDYGQPQGSVTAGVFNDPISTSQLADAGRDVEYAVAMPVGTVAVLSLGAAGYSQSFSLTTARRIGTAPTALYRSPSTYELALEPDQTDRVSERDPQSGATAAVDVTLTEVELDWFYPGYPDEHAPNPDEAYLAIVLASAEEPGPSGVSFGGLSASLDSHVRLVLASGTSLRAKAFVPALSDFLDGTWIFLVPADLGAAELVVTPGVQSSGELSPSGSEAVVPVSYGDASWHIELPGGTSGSAGQATGETSASPARTSPASTTVPLRAHALVQRSNGALSLPAKAAAGGGGLVVVVGVILIPLRRRRRGAKAEVTFPPPVLPPPPLAEDATPLPPLATEERPAPAAGERVEPVVAPAQVLRVLLLGPHGVGGFEKPPPRPIITELASLLAYKAPQTVTSGEMRMALGDGVHDLGPGTLNTYLSKLRSCLGEGRLVKDGRYAYRLVGELDCDWASFQALVARDEPEGRIAALEAALALVRGVPFSGTPRGRYRWAEQPARDMQRAIREAAHELVELQRRAGRWNAAEAAAIAGLRAEPSSRELWEDRLRAVAACRARFDVAFEGSLVELPGDQHLARLRDELLGDAVS